MRGCFASLSAAQTSETLAGSSATGTHTALSFTADFEAKDLKKVLIDQKEIDAKNYVTAGKENTQVTLKAEYTKSLAEGKHTISIVSSKGQADTVFYLKKATKSPDTGDRTQVMLGVILLGVSAAAVVGAVVYRKREK